MRNHIPHTVLSRKSLANVSKNKETSNKTALEVFHRIRLPGSPWVACLTGQLCGQSWLRPCVSPPGQPCGDTGQVDWLRREVREEAMEILLPLFYNKKVEESDYPVAHWTSSLRGVAMQSWGVGCRYVCWTVWLLNTLWLHLRVWAEGLRVGWE